MKQNLSLDNLLKNKIDTPLFNEAQLFQLKQGFKQNLDITIYANPKFNANQMSEIRLGLEHGIDATKYANPDIDYLNMQSLRIYMESTRLQLSKKHVITYPLERQTHETKPLYWQSHKTLSW